MAFGQTPVYCISTNFNATVGSLSSGTTTTPNGTSTAQFSYPVYLKWDCTQGPASGGSECGVCVFASVYIQQSDADVLVTQGSTSLISGDCGSTGNAWTVTVTWPPSGAANNSNSTLIPGSTYFMAIWVKPFNPYNVNSPCSNMNDINYNKLGNYEYTVPQTSSQ